MSNLTKYRITCGSCKKNRDVVIDNNEVIMWDERLTNPYEANIVSGRKRLDSEFGWQCICGNNSIMTEQEKRLIEDVTNPTPQEIGQIMRNLIPEKPKFEMEAI